MSDDLTQDLISSLGEDGFLKLVEAHAGTRLYVPADPDRSDLPATIGYENAARLAKVYPGGYLRIPLAREMRAIRYHRDGATNGDIARRLGLTEPGVQKLLQRARSKKLVERKSRTDPRQIEMFPKPADTHKRA